MTPPPRIVTRRLLLRCWTSDDAPGLRDAVDTSLDHLREWMPWAESEPTPLPETRERLDGYRRAFEAGEDFVYGIFDAAGGTVLGGCGLHPRVGPGGLEIGYWIRASHTGRGLATEAARALTDAGLSVAGIDRIEIHCDPGNASSRRVPEKLGYRLLEVREEDFQGPGGKLRDTVVYVKGRPEDPSVRSR